jgi:hypothetical protein
MTRSEAARFIADKTAWPTEAVAGAIFDLEKCRDIRKFLFEDGSAVYWFTQDNSFLGVAETLREVAVTDVLDRLFP